MFYDFFGCFSGIFLTCQIENGNIVALSFGRKGASRAPSREAAGLWKDVEKQLTEYFDGRRREFDLPVKTAGTDFQMLVWEELRRIPYGRTRSYGEIANAIGKPGAARAVGGACNKNPIAIIIPCHRVIGADRSLTGFGGGLEVKKRLLELEGIGFKK